MKICRRCTKEFPLDAFYVHKEMADGHLNFCKGCVKARVRNHRSKNLNAIQAYDRARGRNTERCARAREYRKKNPGVVKRALEHWQQQNPHKKKASTAVNNAVRYGRLTKAPCEVCGALKVEGHHDDYDKPLEVRWLCDTHHKEHHNQLRGLRRAA